MNDQTTTEQKIDYIYDTLKKQERNQKFRIAGKWIFRVFMIGYLVYFYQVTLPSLKAEVYDKLTPDISIWNSEIFDTAKKYLDNF